MCLQQVWPAKPQDGPLQIKQVLLLYDHLLSLLLSQCITSATAAPDSFNNVPFPPPEPPPKFSTASLLSSPHQTNLLLQFQLLSAGEQSLFRADPSQASCPHHRPSAPPSPHACPTSSVQRVKLGALLTSISFGGNVFLSVTSPKRKTYVTSAFFLSLIPQSQTSHKLIMRFFLHSMLPLISTTTADLGYCNGIQTEVCLQGLPLLIPSYVCLNTKLRE